jgi:hypothetical protein
MQTTTAEREPSCTDSCQSLRLLLVLEDHWRLEVTRRGLAPLSALLPELGGAWDDLGDWLGREDIPDGVPFLISPDLEYDVDLNRYFLRPAMVGSSRNTQLAAARDVRRFLDFLWCSRAAGDGGRRPRPIMTPTGTGGARILAGPGWRGDLEPGAVDAQRVL